MDLELIFNAFLNGHICATENIDWNYALIGAVCGGHEDLISLCLEKGANCFKVCFYTACEIGNWHLIHLMISKGVNNWTSGIKYAARGNQTNVIVFLLEKGGKVTHKSIKWAGSARTISLLNNHK